MLRARIKLPASASNATNRKPRSKIYSQKYAKFPKEKIVSLYLAECIGNSVPNLMIKHVSKQLQKKDGLVNKTETKYKKHMGSEELITQDASKFLPVTETGPKPEPKKKRKKRKPPGKKFIRDFIYYAKFGDEYSIGNTISYSQTLRWLKKAELLDNRRITIRDVEVHFIDKLKNGHELNILEFIRFLKSLSEDRGLHMSTAIFKLLKCRPHRKKVKKKLKNVSSNIIDVETEKKIDIENLENAIKVCGKKDSEISLTNQLEALEQNKNIVKNILFHATKQEPGFSCKKNIECIVPDKKFKKELEKKSVTNNPQVRVSKKKRISKWIYPTVKSISGTEEDYSSRTDCKFYRTNYKKKVTQTKNQVKPYSPLKLDGKTKQKTTSINTHLNVNNYVDNLKADEKNKNDENMQTDISLTDLKMNYKYHAEINFYDATSHKCIDDSEKYSDKGKESVIGKTGSSWIVKNSFLNSGNANINQKMNEFTDIEVFHPMEPTNDIFEDLKTISKADDDFSSSPELMNTEMAHLTAPLNGNSKEDLSDVYGNNCKKNFSYTNNEIKNSPVSSKNRNSKGMKQPFDVKRKYSASEKKNLNITKIHDAKSGKRKKPNNCPESEDKFKESKPDTKVKSKDNRTFTNLPVNQVKKIVNKTTKANISDKRPQNDKKCTHLKFTDSKSDSKIGHEATFETIIEKVIDNLSIETKLKKELAETTKDCEKKYKIRKGIKLKKKDMKDPETEIRKLDS